MQLFLLQYKNNLNSLNSKQCSSNQIVFVQNSFGNPSLFTIERPAEHYENGTDLVIEKYHTFVNKNDRKMAAKQRVLTWINKVPTEGIIRLTMEIVLPGLENSNWIASAFDQNESMQLFLPNFALICEILCHGDYHGN